ncbi:hypothetical protein [Sulfurimonas sp. NW9]|uniref:hypothetical protein n=1 Tax=Sulfurimonas sp. NW9 TaxID=2922728 RepID=UPI003DA99BDE
MSLKFVLLPLVAFVILYNIDLAPMIKGIIFIELLMPLAVANVNLASLYDCQPKLVTALVFSLLFYFWGLSFLVFPYSNIFNDECVDCIKKIYLKN